MGFKKGDKVRVSERVDIGYRHLIGKETTIKSVNANGNYEITDPWASNWREEELELIKEKNMSTKYYRVIKDHPAFETGAILSNEGDGNYRVIDDIFNKEIEGYTPSEKAGSFAGLVENQTEWFERVYPLGKLEKLAFGTRKQAQASAAALYKGDKKAK